MNQNQDLKLNIDLKNTEKVETPGRKRCGS